MCHRGPISAFVGCLRERKTVGNRYPRQVYTAGKLMFRILEWRLEAPIRLQPERCFAHLELEVIHLFEFSKYLLLLAAYS